MERLHLQRGGAGTRGRAKSISSDRFGVDSVAPTYTPITGQGNTCWVGQTQSPVLRPRQAMSTRVALCWVRLQLVRARCTRSALVSSASRCLAASTAARPPSPRTRLADAPRPPRLPPRPAACERASACWRARRCASLSAAYGREGAPCGRPWLGRGSDEGSAPGCTTWSGLGLGLGF